MRSVTMHRVARSALADLAADVKVSRASARWDEVLERDDGAIVARARTDRIAACAKPAVAGPLQIDARIKIERGATLAQLGAQPAAATHHQIDPVRLGHRRLRTRLTGAAFGRPPLPPPPSLADAAR